MGTIQIQHALQDVNSFLGVYASDLLPLSIVQTGTIIVNTDPHTQPGKHWHAIHFQNPIAPQTVTFSIPTAATHIFPPS